jgi:hypothetical protein
MQVNNYVFITRVTNLITTCCGLGNYIDSVWLVSVRQLTPWSESANELYRPSDRRLSAK